ncbi:hypothetical protein [Flavobacterium sp.]|uniref:hypothetical protein n=1 Tax=Flavobacterium sp. TaxID=239 RepID=UPI003D6C5938
MGTLFFAAMGWCGTKYPGWWRGPRKPQPDPWKPRPDPWKYLILVVLGVGIGVASGTVFNNAIENDTIFAGQGMIASGLFSFAASNIVTGLISAKINRGV